MPEVLQLPHASACSRALQPHASYWLQEYFAWVCQDPTFTLDVINQHLPAWGAWCYLDLYLLHVQPDAVLRRGQAPQAKGKQDVSH